MARQINRLSARSVATNSKPGRHADGGGLYLIVDKGGAKRWAFLFRREGRLREMGLGGINGVTLGRARELAADCRAKLASGLNPIEARRQSRQAALRIPTFGEHAISLLDDIEMGFRNAKHKRQWRQTLQDYCRPIWSTPIDRVDTAGVLACLTPIWQTKQKTALQLRGRIERVLASAKAKNLREGENPATWKNHLNQTLSKPDKRARAHHHAMPFDDVSEVVRTLRTKSGLAPRALEFLILTAARSGEVLGALRSEIDLEAGVWAIPGTRMKTGAIHRVPLSSRAIDIARDIMQTTSTSYLFPGLNPGRRLGHMALSNVLMRAKVDATVHGFRSSFRDWCGEKTDFPREIAEAALAHRVGDETERAYRRGDALEKRRRLMEAWAWCEPREPNVVAFAKPSGAAGA
jgi:integrase